MSDKNIALLVGGVMTWCGVMSLVGGFREHIPFLTSGGDVLSIWAAGVLLTIGGLCIYDGVRHYDD